MMKMKSNPKVSIIMPAYNAAETIQASIDSIKSQTWAGWELIIIDDGSKDITQQIINAAAKSDHRVRPAINKRNMGVAATRNAGIHMAKGEWIAFLDSDDLWHEDKLEKQLAFIDASNAAISYTATAYINKAGEVSNYVLPARHKLDYRQLLRSNIMSCSSVMVSRDVITRYPFPEGGLHEDYVVWLKILREVGFAYGVDMPLLQYRMTDTSKSGRRFSSAIMIYHAYRVVGYGRVGAFLLTLRYAAHSIPKRGRVRRGWKGEG